MLVYWVVSGFRFQEIQIKDLNLVFISFLGIPCSIFDVQYSVFDVRCSIFGVRYSMFDVRCSIFDIRCSMFNIRCSMFDVRISSFGPRTTANEVTSYSRSYRLPSRGACALGIRAKARSRQRQQIFLKLLRCP